MKQILFTGANNTGKSLFMTYVANLLGKLGKQVLVIDTTKSQSLKYNFSLNDMDTFILKQKEDVLSMYGFDIALIEGGINKSYLSSLDLSKYDYVLIEGDINTDISNFNISDTFFFFNFDIRAINENLEFIRRKTYLANVNLVFNQAIDCKVSTKYILNSISTIDSSILNKELDPIIIEFSEEDIITSLNNRFIGRLNIKQYTNEFKAAVMTIVQSISNEENKIIRKALERR